MKICENFKEDTYSPVFTTELTVFLYWPCYVGEHSSFLIHIYLHYSTWYVPRIILASFNSILIWKVDWKRFVFQYFCIFQVFRILKIYFRNAENFHLYRIELTFFKIIFPRNNPHLFSEISISISIYRISIYRRSNKNYHFEYWISNIVGIMRIREQFFK